MSEYDDLLAQLKSDDAPIRPTTTMSRVGEHTFGMEIDSEKLKQETYTKDDLYGFLGFITSYVASATLNTSTRRAAELAKGDLLEKRFAEYKRLSKENFHDISDGAEELAKAFSNVVRKAINGAVASEDTKIGLVEPMTLPRAVAGAIAMFFAGRGWEQLPEGNRPDPAELIGGFLVAMLEAPDQIGDHINSLIKDILEELGDIDTKKMANDPMGWAKDWQEKLHDKEK